MQSTQANRITYVSRTKACEYAYTAAFCCLCANVLSQSAVAAHMCTLPHSQVVSPNTHNTHQTPPLILNTSRSRHWRAASWCSICLLTCCYHRGWGLVAIHHPTISMPSKCQPHAETKPAAAEHLMQLQCECWGVGIAFQARHV